MCSYMVRGEVYHHVFHDWMLQLDGLQGQIRCAEEVEIDRAVKLFFATYSQYARVDLTLERSLQQATQSDRGSSRRSGISDITISRIKNTVILENAVSIV